MRRITGIYDGTEQVILEHEHGIVEGPFDLLQALRVADNSVPPGEALVEQCRKLFGPTLKVQEME